VLLLHGFPQTSYEWMAQLKALARAGYRAVAPDQRGYSPGARPADVASYNVIALVGDTLGMATALGYERFHLVGHDWGGGVAWGVAGVAPERVRTLTALSTPHPAALATALADTASCQYQASAYFDILSDPNASLASLAQIGVGFDGVPQDAIDEYFAKVLSQPDVLNAALNWYRANLANRVLTGTIGAVTVPTLYMWGTADVTFCRETAEDTANYVDARYRFVPLEGAGHWLPEAASGAVNEELLAHLSRK
jgi:pimeloyl-ACP methyl ester carboxylesterase